MDDDDLFLELVARVLERHGYVCRAVSAQAGPAVGSLVRGVMRSRPDVVVATLDLKSGYGDGGAMLQSLTGAGYCVMSLTDSGDPVRVGEALFLGAHSVAAKTMPLDQFLAVLSSTERAASPAEQQERDHQIEQYRRHHGADRGDSQRLASLSQQERDVLNLLVEGRLVREIVARRVVSPHTVRTQIKSILGKLEVASQAEAVALARHHSWMARTRRQPGLATGTG
ncbi:response regulator transcription factor [Nocardioides sp. LMS-CY]|uniref:response regulator transcription factor n=1 Tax=Nocardioides sp. (strain LMS-CY) TaxID=2840457 RepID=UPI001BFFE95B|nr:response regulator transcription factor [Nocardioides sp. LMS-CY]QWF20204.1 response regulator transcription factor [Nocardioides sp. LMS-CY]